MIGNLIRNIKSQAVSRLRFPVLVLTGLLLLVTLDIVDTNNRTPQTPNSITAFERMTEKQTTSVPAEIQPTAPIQQTIFSDAQPMPTPTTQPAVGSGATIIVMQPTPTLVASTSAELSPTPTSTPSATATPIPTPDAGTPTLTPSITLTPSPTVEPTGN